MNILFISYAEVSLRRGSVRAVAMISALADAGHRVDVAAPVAGLADHPHIRVFCGRQGRASRHRIRMECLRAAGRTAYDAVHAVDEAVFFAARLCRWKRIPLAYDASRRFGGRAGSESSRLLRWFPKHFQRLEAKVLDRAEIVFTHCGALSSDLQAVVRELSVVQIEDIPAQPLYALPDFDSTSLRERFGVRPASIVVCCLLPGGDASLRNMFLAARKVVDAMPDAVFFFRGARREEARKMAASLDISENCAFLSDDEPEKFLSALEAAHAVFMVPPAGGRYIHPQVYTLLQAGAPLVAVQDAAYDEVLTDRTAIRVLPGSDAIAEGILRVVQEPLFSLAIALEGQQLVANNHTYSSFKHKVRMSYLELGK